MEADGVDVLMLSVGSDLPYFCGYEAMPLERIPCSSPSRGRRHACHPGPRTPCSQRPEIFSIAPWGETEDHRKTADLAGAADTVAIVTTCGLSRRSHQPDAQHLVLPGIDHHEPDPAGEGRRGDRPSAKAAVGSPPGCSVARSARRAVEAAVSAELGRQILEEGHDRVNFAIVAAGRTPVRIITPVTRHPGWRTGALISAAR